MPSSLTRRELFGRQATRSAVIPPPWALAFADYANLCDGCGECVSACPESIIKRDEDNLAVVDFKAGICDFCGDCEDICPTGALDKTEGRPAWLHKAEISAKCFSTQGIVCRLCEEACEPRAITFRLLVAGKSIPLINLDQCNGCGGCLSVCPTDAVSMEFPENSEIFAKKEQQA